VIIGLTRRAENGRSAASPVGMKQRGDQSPGDETRRCWASPSDARKLAEALYSGAQPGAGGLRCVGHGPCSSSLTDGRCRGVSSLAIYGYVDVWSGGTDGTMDRLSPRRPVRGRRRLTLSTSAPDVLPGSRTSRMPSRRMSPGPGIRLPGKPTAAAPPGDCFGEGPRPPFPPARQETRRAAASPAPTVLRGSIAVALCEQHPVRVHEQRAVPPPRLARTQPAPRGPQACGRPRPPRRGSASGAPDRLGPAPRGSA